VRGLENEKQERGGAMNYQKNIAPLQNQIGKVTRGAKGEMFETTE